MNKQFKLGTDSWSPKKWGIQILPPTFATDGKKYPVIPFFHGVGEADKAGDPKNPRLDLLMNQGPIPFAGQLSDFIIIALQDQYYSPDPSWVDYILQNDPELKGRIGATIYTGLSAGGQMVLDAVTTNQEMANRITAIVPMSAPGLKNYNGLAFAKNAKVKARIYGTNDGVCNGGLMDDICLQLGGERIQTPPTHGGWDKIYGDPTFHAWLRSVSGTVVVDPPPQKKVAHTLYTDGTWD